MARTLLNSYGCQICGGYPENTTLIGGYHTRLCVEHLNEWSTFIRDSDLYLERGNILIEIQLAVEGGYEKRAKEKLIRLNNMDRQLFDIGASWVAARKAAQEKEK